MLTVGSLFSGIGGLDLGLERAGMQVKWQVEIDPYCNRVLEKHWPSVKRYGDIKQVDWSKVEPIDLICGGFPCQPVSVAGARKGDKDDRWLWPEFLRAIREVRPRYALVENVPGLFSADDGRLARGVFGDLAEIGYDADWDCVSAADVGAPHLRGRLFIIAYPCESRTRLEISGNRGQERTASRIFQREMVRQEDWKIGSEGVVSGSAMEDSRCLAREKGAEVEGIISGLIGEGDSRGQSAGPDNAFPDPECQGLFSEYQPQEGQVARYSGFEQQWAVEPDVGRVADGVPSRVDRLRCLGNAVVPQVAEYIGRLIMNAEKVGERK
jgi:DNA (cytosine-5)-methyltransferase 1